MPDTEQTPIMSQHARQRCAEMGISTKVAKRIWKTRTLIRAVRGERERDRVLVSSAEVPDYLVVVEEGGWYGTGGPPVVITVMFQCGEEYVREGETYRVVS